MSPTSIVGLACPRCHGSLETRADALYCRHCQVSYPVLDGIPSFVSEVPAPRSADSVDLSIVLLSGTEGSAERVSRIEEEVKPLGVSHEVLFVDQLQARSDDPRTRGAYVLTLDRDGIADPRVVKTLWEARDRADVVVARAERPPVADAAGRFRRRFGKTMTAMYQRALSLPVGDGTSGNRIYRAPAFVPPAPGSRHPAADSLIQAMAGGYTAAEVGAPTESVVPGGDQDHRRLRFKAFYDLWKLRNSIASADYDARAYNSIVPLQRYWQRSRYRVIAGAARGYTSVLDVGCGSSRILSANQRMVGLDIQLNKLRYARRFGNPLVHGSIFALPFEDQAFDCVICSEVIEHVPPEERAFDELIRVLKPGGRLILGTPDYDRWSWRALEWLYARVSPGGYADEHITHYSRPNLQRYLEGRGMVVESVDYVCGSEMIFRLRKAAPTTADAGRLPVTAGLRAKQPVAR